MERIFIPVENSSVGEKDRETYFARDESLPKKPYRQVIVKRFEIVERKYLVEFLGSNKTAAFKPAELFVKAYADPVVAQVAAGGAKRSAKKSRKQKRRVRKSRRHRRR